MVLERVAAEGLSVAPAGSGELVLGTASLSRVTLQNLSIGRVALRGNMKLDRVSVADKAAFFDWRPSPDGLPRGLLWLVRCEAETWSFAAGGEGRGGGPASCSLLDCKAGMIKWGWDEQTRVNFGASSYRGLILSGANRRSDASAARIEFLKRNQQPRAAYLALSASLASVGEQDEADDVRYALRCLDIEKARRAGNRWRAGLLWMLDVTMGFGIGLRTFRCLSSIGILVVTGAAVIQLFEPSAGRYDIAWTLGASLHRLLPIVNLSPRYVEFFHDLPQDNTLGYLQNAYFCLHSALGWLLGAFLIAGLAGMTQKRG